MTSDDLSSRSLGGEGGGGKTTLSHLFLSFWYLSVYYYILSFQYTWLRTHAQLTQSAVVSSDLAVGPVRMPLGHRRPCSLISFHSLVSFISAFPLPLFSVWLRGSFPFLSLCLFASSLPPQRPRPWPRRVLPATPRTRRLPHEILLASRALSVLAASPRGALPSPRPAEEPRGAAGGGAGRGLRSAALARSSSSSVARPQ